MNYGKFCSLCLIGGGMMWLGTLTTRMMHDGLFPWQYRTVEIPKSCPDVVPIVGPHQEGCDAIRAGG